MSLLPVPSDLPAGGDLSPSNVLLANPSPSHSCLSGSFSSHPALPSPLSVSHTLNPSKPKHSSKSPKLNSNGGGGSSIAKSPKLQSSTSSFASAGPMQPPSTTISKHKSPKPSPLLSPKGAGLAPKTPSASPRKKNPSPLQPRPCSQQQQPNQRPDLPRADSGIEVVPSRPVVHLMLKSCFRWAGYTIGFPVLTATVNLLKAGWDLLSKMRGAALLPIPGLICCPRSIAMMGSRGCCHCIECSSICSSSRWTIHMQRLLHLHFFQQPSSFCILIVLRRTCCTTSSCRYVCYTSLQLSFV